MVRSYQSEGGVSRSSSHMNRVKGGYFIKVVMTLRHLISSHTPLHLGNLYCCCKPCHVTGSRSTWRAMAQQQLRRWGSSQTPVRSDISWRRRASSCGRPFDQSTSHHILAYICLLFHHTSHITLYRLSFRASSILIGSCCSQSKSPPLPPRAKPVHYPSGLWLANRVLTYQ